VRFQVGNALAMPFDDRAFEGVFSMFVSMNIADKAKLYCEVHRVLKSNGWFLLSAIARGKTGGVTYPTPWASTAAESFLATPDDTCQELRNAGFEIEHIKDDLQRSLDFASRSQAAVERGEKPPYRAGALIHGEIARVTLANVARGFKDGSLIPIEVRARKR